MFHHSRFKHTTIHTLTLTPNLLHCYSTRFSLLPQPATMALEAVVFHHDPTYSYGGSRDLYSIAGGFCYPGGLDRKDEKPLCGENHNILMKEFHWEAPTFSSSPENNSAGRDGFQQLGPEEVLASATRCRRKRRRAKNVKNEEQVENQRMTHIAVERNRRRQMNEYLAVLRSMMPASFVQRGDQASIVGGAINFVKELEQLLQSLEGHEKMTEFHQASEININVQSRYQNQRPRNSWPLPTLKLRWWRLMSTSKYCQEDNQNSY
ncbi:transcription factor bHLH96-like isoform X3 [Carica papaya]|uniref:transcription factor bHLH96-like isoform X3 n=1 Tax=Carica papaya TaxID=3649 RepID=UPI000B8CB773|nr:transcription factor bHLH96-like isoform X3 [Carica papaya]